MDMCRRAFLSGLAVTPVATGPGLVRAQTDGPRTYGCCIPHTYMLNALSSSSEPTTFDVNSLQRIPHSASPKLDYAFAQGLAKICSLFEVMPAFTYYRESSSGDYNALATQELILDRTDGTVFYGLNMLSKQMGGEFDDVGVIAIAAHEFGHIVAMKRRFNNQLAPDLTQPYKAEQFADFMAGVYAGFRKIEKPEFPAIDFPMIFRSLGEPDRGTHGTPEERGIAVAKGYEASYIHRLNLNDAVHAGFSFAMSRT